MESLNNTYNCKSTAEYIGKNKNKSIFDAITTKNLGAYFLLGQSAHSQYECIIRRRSRP